MLPLFGLPRGDTPTLLAVTTVIEFTKLAVVAYGKHQKVGGNCRSARGMA